MDRCVAPEEAPGPTLAGMRRTGVVMGARRWLRKLVPAALWNALARAALRAADEETRFDLGLPSHQGVLRNMRRAGFLPRSVVDVGANRGNWSRMASEIYPEANFFLFEANRQYEASLRDACRSIANSEYRIDLLGATSGELVAFHVMGDGSSVFPEVTSFPRKTVSMATRTLDESIPELARSPMLVKLDVQGYELEVLKGSRRVLSLAEVVLLETALLTYNEGSPLFVEVVEFMADKGFVVFDFCGHARRQEDQALFQIDIVFVRERSLLRSRRKFWLEEQL